MPRNDQASSLAGSFRMFQVAGISVYLHWSWLLVAYFELQVRGDSYQHQIWNLVEYLTLFGIVLLHEFGHALACRQVGGRADEIVLWPLGGIAFVQPPARPGAWLWSIAAGPLVNVALVPVTVGAYLLARSEGLQEINPDGHRFLEAVMVINLVLLLFNILPIYPLDGGQILQALLWFVIGRSNSLRVVSVIGLVAGIPLVALAVYDKSWWFAIMAGFLMLRSWAGFQQARLLAQLEQVPRHLDAACPVCRAHPVMGEFAICDHCQMHFDTYTHMGSCPNCSSRYSLTECPECLQIHPIVDWYNR